MQDSQPAECMTLLAVLSLAFEGFLLSTGVKLATLSADPVESHTKWLDDVVVGRPRSLKL